MPWSHCEMADGFDLTVWYRRFGEAVYRRAARVLRDSAAADDVVQETFLRAHRYRASYAGGSALSWLFAICDRVCFDALRRQQRVRVGDGDDVADVVDALSALEGDVFDDAAARTPPAAGARLEREQLVARALAGVDDETKAILLHRYFDELDTVQIAQTLSLSERTVRRRLAEFFSRARRRIDALATPPPEVHP
jgi:RNA polymerase sigma-70 factor (ECF subfamily)